MNKSERLEEYLNEVTDERLLMRIYNEYCDTNRYYDDMVYLMSDIDEIWQDLKPSEILYKIDGCDFSYNNKYFKFDYNSASSFDSIKDVYEFDAEELAEYILEIEKNYGDDCIREILDSDEEDCD